jgi:hypothetical protein
MNEGIIEKILNRYYKMPLLSNIGILCFAFLFFVRFDVVPEEKFDVPTCLGIIGSIISAYISLAGFVLAALTIIVTFKASLKAKKIEDSENGMEMILNSEHYEKVVKVFKSAITEYIIYSLVLFLVWVFNKYLSLSLLLYSILAGLFIISIVTIRSLFVLFSILNMSTTRK